MAKKHIIYSSEIRDIDSQEFRNDYQECMDLTDEQMEEVSSDTLYDWACEENSLWLEDERTNLDIKLPKNIIVIADLGLWSGRRSGFKVIGNNVNNILSCANGDYYEVYCDAYNVRATDSHHDGTNYYIFREIKEGVNIENFKEKLFNGTYTKADISRYTKSLRKRVADIYGW